MQSIAREVAQADIDSFRHEQGARLDGLSVGTVWCGALAVNVACWIGLVAALGAI